MEFTERFGEKRSDENIMYTVAIGEIDPFATGKKARDQEDVIRFVKTLPGFVGVHPVSGRGTILLFRTEKEAKEARQKLKDKGCPVGMNVTECFVPKKYVSELQ